MTSRKVPSNTCVAHWESLGAGEERRGEKGRSRCHVCSLLPTSSLLGQTWELTALHALLDHHMGAGRMELSRSLAMPVSGSPDGSPRTQPVMPPSPFQVWSTLRSDPFCGRLHAQPPWAKMSTVCSEEISTMSAD